MEKITPKKSLGQNFLVNPHILDKIISAAEITSNDLVLEIGPGTGRLTEALSHKAGKVIAIEKDKRLIEPLKEKFSSRANVKILEGDILEIGTQELFKESPYKIVANIPYNITANLLRRIFEEFPTPELIVLMVQKEVAQRIISKPPRMNLLALSVQYYSNPEIVGYISKNNFKPVPKIDSAIIRLRPRPLQAEDKKSEEKLFSLIKTGFSGKRKQLISNLSRGFKIDKDRISEVFDALNLDRKIRAEELSLEQWTILNKDLHF